MTEWSTDECDFLGKNLFAVVQGDECLALCATMTDAVRVAHAMNKTETMPQCLVDAVMGGE